MARARKRFGQHFLESSWVPKVVDAIQPEPGDVFIEIGPGRGALTFALAERAAAVVAIEIDRTLAAQLRRSAPTSPRLFASTPRDVPCVSPATCPTTSRPPSFSG
jgi:16S rRNA A1518/A1519 N6-dimethyltransferase RsmA/KsgA/DIM1 with predicted DNA glycosylase/AP lyase activity